MIDLRGNVFVGFIRTFLILIIAGVFMLTTSVGVLAENEPQSNRNTLHNATGEMMTRRANLYVQTDGDSPMRPGSGGNVGSVFAWTTPVGVEKRVLQILGVLTPEGVIPEEVRPSSGDIFLSIYRDGPPGETTQLTTDQFSTLGSFRPPRGPKQVVVFHKKIPLLGQVDRDGNQHLELQIILKPDKRGLAQSCKNVFLCGVSSNVISIPIEDNKEAKDSPPINYGPSTNKSSETDI